MHRILAAVLAVTVALTGASACSNKQRVQTETELAKILVPDEQEKAIGLAVKEELGKQNIRYLQDADVEAYVDAIAEDIFVHAEKDRPNIDWHVHIVDDPEVVNAFATPGGHLYVFTGLLLAADDEAEVAGVLAHEAGHVVGRHSARQMVNAFGLQAIAALALGENPPLLAALAANIAGTGAMLAHSRADEYEADVFGVRYASASGYDPRGISRFFKKLGQKQGKTPKALTWLSTHPASQDRVERTEKYIARHNLSGAQKNVARHEAVQAILEQRPVKGTDSKAQPPHAHPKAAPEQPKKKVIIIRKR